MRVYNYVTDKPESGKFINASIYNDDFYLVPITLSKAEKEKLLAEIATYCVRETSDDDTDWDCDSSRSSSSSSDNYIDVPTDHIIIKNGAFWGYRIKAESWTGGATYENRQYEWKIVCLDNSYVEVYYYSVTTSDYDRTKETDHTLVKRSNLKK